MITENEEFLIGYLIAHPNTKLPELCCIGLPLTIPEIGNILKGLIGRGIVLGRGYSAHVEEYYVPKAKEFSSFQHIGQLYCEWLNNAD